VKNRRGASKVFVSPRFVSVALPPATFSAASTLTKRYDFPLTVNSVGVRSDVVRKDEVIRKRPPRSVRSSSPVMVTPSGSGQIEYVSWPTGRSSSDTSTVPDSVGGA
jgi:hypothetical protein